MDCKTGKELKSIKKRIYRKQENGITEALFVGSIDNIEYKGIINNGIMIYLTNYKDDGQITRQRERTRNRGRPLQTRHFQNLDQIAIKGLAQRTLPFLSR